MTSEDVWLTFKLPLKLRTAAKLATAIPWLRTVARYETAEYNNYKPEDLTQQQIEKYLLNHKQYDATEIAKLVNYFRVYATV